MVKITNGWIEHIVLSILSASVLASDLLIGTDADGNLYSVDTETDAPSLIGDTGVRLLAGLEYAKPQRWLKMQQSIYLQGFLAAQACSNLLTTGY